MCRSRSRASFQPSTAASIEKQEFQLATLSSVSGKCNKKVNLYVLVNGTLANCRLDTGAKFNHINTDFCRQNKIKVNDKNNTMQVDLAVKGAAVQTQGVCSTSVELRVRENTDVKFSVMNGLLWDVILGRDFLSQHKSVSFKFGDLESPLELGALLPIKGLEPVRLFEHLSPNCRPLTTKRRNYSKTDQSFISSHISQLLEDDIIETSSSPWRA